MCGIIGYIGPNKTEEILLTGLKNLEYRGYDSSGIALKNQKEKQIIKSVGKISNLEEKLKEKTTIDSSMGIAHTRWATHGKPIEKNAHPHTSGDITLVHNGIIENAEELKNKLITEGEIFKTDTDTEVISVLLNKYNEENFINSINKVISLLEGSFALAIIREKDDNLYATRKESPLIIGTTLNEKFICSDISAIVEFTKDYYLLSNNEIAKIKGDQITFYNENKEVNKEIITTTISKETQDKGKYEHFMLKEIMEQPTLLKNTLEYYKTNLNRLPDLSKYEEIHIVACGSAYYAGMLGKSLLEEYANIKVDIEVASEYRYKKVIYDRKTLVIVISQSGETADTIASLRKAKENNIETLAIVNVTTSTIARESDNQIFIEAGAEIAVATTKAYFLQVTILSLLTYKSAKEKNIISNEQELLKDINKLPTIVENLLNENKKYKEIAREIYKSEHLYFLGRKIDYANCMEGSLKLKEVSYIHSEAYQAGELKHGTISLIENNTPVISIITDNSISKKTISNIEEVRSRGAKVLTITNEDLNIKNQLIIPKVHEYLQPLLVAPVMQLIAYYTAELRGCDIDKPKNLAKSVTVE